MGKDHEAIIREALAPDALRKTALRHAGVDVENPDELAPLAAIGLTLRLWRNTELEDAHCSGIPDDVMFRINASTCADVGEVVREALDDPPSDLTDWLVSLAGLVWDADRALVVGDSSWLVGDIYEALARDEKDGMPNGALHAASTLSLYGDVVGFDGVLRFLGTSGALAGRDWAGTPWWPTIIERYAVHAATTDSGPWSDDDVQVLLLDPASVRGPVATDRVRFHWTTTIEDEAFRDFRVERLLAAGVATDQPPSVPVWLLV